MDKSELELERRSFPIGRAVRQEQYRSVEVERGIRDLEQLPLLLREKTRGLGNSDLERRYRAGGWTVRQVIHHLADSHVNSYTRFKLALTEDRPVIKPYQEARWAELADGRTGDIGFSLSILDGVHARLVALLRSLEKTDFLRSFFHPETGREVHLFENVGIYAWHGRHHLAHIDLALSSPA